MDLSDLLKPLAGEPAGPDLSYDDERRLIEEAFALTDTGARMGEGKWTEVIARARKQATLTRDLWLPIYLARAGARAGQLEVVAEGAQLLAGLLEEHWPVVHPQLDEVGFQGRKSACDNLAHAGEFIVPLEQLVLIAHPRLGSFTAADLARLEQNGEAEEDYGRFRAVLEQTDQAEIAATLDTLDRVREALGRADAVLVANAGAETGTDFAPTYAALAEIRKRLARHGPAAAPVAEPAAPAEAAGSPTGGPAAVATAAPSARGAPGAIESRDDVVRALDAIADYYRRREPASPVPVVLARARAWVPMGFMEVLADIAPASLDDAQRVLMSRAMIEAGGGD